MSTRNVEIPDAPASSPSSQATRLIARQPILTRARRVYGYELLFRQNDSLSVVSDPDAATRQVVVDGMLLHGLGHLVRNHKAFINFTRETLLSADVGFLPHDRVVIEILEDIEPDSDVLASCARLKKAGYPIALDDVTSCDRVRSFSGIADIVKVDLPQTTTRERMDLIECCTAVGAVPLIEKVETYEDFHAASDMGYQYFQGFFFGEPEVLSSSELPASKLGYLRVLQAVHTSGFNPTEIARVIKSESTLCYRLLRYLNSAFFSFANRVDSVPHAVTILGEQGIRKYVSLLALAAMTTGKPTELAMTSLVRAAWCESLDVARLPDREGRFLLGLMSLVDAVLDIEMEDVLDQMTLSPAISTALLERKGASGGLLQLLEAYERGQWNEVARLASSLGVREEDVSKEYLNALRWAEEVLSQTA